MYIFVNGILSDVEIHGNNCTVNNSFWGAPCENRTSKFGSPLFVLSQVLVIALFKYYKKLMKKWIFFIN